MAHDKNKKNNPEEDINPLEIKIDAMMSPENKSVEPATPAPKEDAAIPTIDIFKDIKTAPKVSASLLKEIGVEEKPAPATQKPQKPDAPKAPEPKTVDEPVLVENEAKQEPEKTSDTTEEVPNNTEIKQPDIIEEDVLASKDTDKAVDEIAAEESDRILEIEDSYKSPIAVVDSPKKKRKFSLKKLLKSKKFWIVTLILLITIFAVPYTRYKAIGLVYKPAVELSITDQETKTPVSNAVVTLNGTTVKTDGNGTAKFKTKPGEGTLLVTKKYYKNYSKEQFVGLRGNKIIKITVIATGRQVPIKVLSSITGEPVQNAEVKVQDSTAKTDKNGDATIVIAATSAKQKAQISRDGYNVLLSDLVSVEKPDPRNTFKITPTGKLYFLSNLSGTMDVVKSDLDGKNRKTVVEGTGKEDVNTTNLLASRDWRYLVLKARRDTPKAALYIIDTQTDKITRFDSGAGDYELIGWHDHDFVYNINRTTNNYWQSGQEFLKSYNADKSELNQIDQTAGEGNSASYAYQGFNNFNILDDLVLYDVSWYSGGSSGVDYDMTSKKSSIRGATPAGKNKKDYKSFETKDASYFTSALHEPGSVYYAVYNNANKPSFYEFQDGVVRSTSEADEDTFNKRFPTYLISPNSKQAFWSDFRDGKNTLFLGDASNIESKKQIATLSDYAPYGWFSNDYLLVSKKGSELYVTTEKVLSNGGSPLKVTDYYKPAQNYSGYGYGGL